MQKWIAKCECKVRGKRFSQLLNRRLDMRDHMTSEILYRWASPHTWILPTSSCDALFNIVKATAVKVMTALKKDTMSVCRHQESSEIRYHEDHEAEVQNTDRQTRAQILLSFCGRLERKFSK